MCALLVVVSSVYPRSKIFTVKIIISVSEASREKKICLYIASFPGSPHQGGEEPGTFYHMRDVKGRDDLIMRG